VCLDVIVVVGAANARLADRGLPDWRAVRLDVVGLWLDLLAGLVRHFLPPSETLY
jgi:hypothetical protein